jgi:molybdopterin synthase sulfur carrier subunit
VRILYFAWLKEKAGCSREEIVAPPGVSTVDGLISFLRQRGGGAAAALADLRVVRVAVNQEYVGLDHPLGADDEVAFFPPVTGGAG